MKKLSKVSKTKLFYLILELDFCHEHKCIKSTVCEYTYEFLKSGVGENKLK
jgi:hypothetical protein